MVFLICHVCYWMVYTVKYWYINASLLYACSGLQWYYVRCTVQGISTTHASHMILRKLSLLTFVAINVTQWSCHSSVKDTNSYIWESLLPALSFCHISYATHPAQLTYKWQRPSDMCPISLTPQNVIILWSSFRGHACISSYSENGCYSLKHQCNY